LSGHIRLLFKLKREIYWAFLFLSQILTEEASPKALGRSAGEGLGMCVTGKFLPSKIAGIQASGVCNLQFEIVMAEDLGLR
jgi:hypothetical protein